MSNLTSQNAKGLIALATAAQAAGDTAQIAEIQAEFERRATNREAKRIVAEDAGEKFEHHVKIAELARKNATQVAAMAAPVAAMATKPSASELGRLKKADLIAIVTAMIDS
jgi:hypothetical protein|tara:strand:+ start:301 stop:633 length:333 start_codon:yes stop_codon:yes gene_type:complete